MGKNLLNTLDDALSFSNHKTFGQIYDQFYQPLYNYGCQFRIAKDDLHDCIQELFIELWNSKDKLAIHYSLKAYIFKSLRYKIQHFIKREQHAHKHLSEYLAQSFEIVFDEEHYIQQHQIEEETLRKLKANIQQLPPRQRELIFLIFFNGVSYEQASTIMDISKKTAYNQVQNAINNLKLSMGDIAISTVLFYLYPQL